jgi:hypothetical protein
MMYVGRLIAGLGTGSITVVVPLVRIILNYNIKKYIPY